MWKALILVAVVVSFVEGCTYKESECSNYTVVTQHQDYEIRSYPALTWAKCSDLSDHPRMGLYKTFMKLFLYINGQNDRDQRMNLTVPILMSNTTLPSNQTLFEMRYLVPADFAANPPTPVDTDVTIVKEKPIIYAVRTFSDFIWNQNVWEEEAKKLANSLWDDATVDKNAYYRARYDSPLDFFDRRNEIWMLKRADNTGNNEV